MLLCKFGLVFLLVFAYQFRLSSQDIFGMWKQFMDMPGDKREEVVKHVWDQFQGAGKDNGKGAPDAVKEMWKKYEDSFPPCNKKDCKKLLSQMFSNKNSGYAEFSEKMKRSNPRVFSWARGPDDKTKTPFTFDVKVNSVDFVGFNYTVTRTDESKGWSDAKLYWAASLPESRTRYSTYYLRDDDKLGTAVVPSPAWFSTPSISAISENKFTVLGRDILMSQVHKLMQDVTNGKFPVKQTTSSEAPFELTIRGDCVYVDDDVSFPSLKKFEIYARKLLSNDKTLDLSASTVCDEIEETSCIYFEKAKDGYDGHSGINGIDSPLVNVYVHELVGDVKFFVRASDGTKGQDGGDGEAGEDRTWESPALDPAKVCKNAMFGSAIENYGPTGGPGGDAMEAGMSGNGGSAPNITVYMEEVSGNFVLEKHSGGGAQPAQHGYGGKGGSGGKGGCGAVCTIHLPFQYFSPSQPQIDPCTLGRPGKTGDRGQDGFVLHEIPNWGKDGPAAYDTLTTIKSVKPWFQDDSDLLRLMQRHGHTLFLRNNRDESKEVFSFIKSVTDEDSEINQDVSFRIKAIAQGFDYYGNTKEHAPDLDWQYLYKRVMTLLEGGKTFENSYNTVKDKIENVEQVKDIVQSIVTESNRKAELQLKNERNEIESRKNLYVKALRKLEQRMTYSLGQSKTVIQKIKDEREKQHASEGADPFKAMEFMGTLVGFGKKIASKDVFGAVKSLKDIIDKFKQKGCKMPTMEQASATLEDRMKFGAAYNDLGPENLDFSKMDVSAVPVIMKSDLGRNKKKLADEISCMLGDGKLKSEKELNHLMENFFRDGQLRITQIDQLLNFNIKLKNIQYRLKVLKESQDAVDADLHKAKEKEAFSIKMQFTDLMFNLYQQQEAEIMSALYELSKAYQFVSLWNFDIMGKYVNNFGDKGMTDHLGSLNGMPFLENILQNLENDRNTFLRHVSSSAGPASHTFNAVWKFDKDNDPLVFQSLYEDGLFTVQLEVDPNDNRVAGCDNCYNGRLISMYIELIGESQAEGVPSTVYVRAVHLGDSNFLLPSNDGAGKTIVTLRQTPGDTAGGNIMTFDFKNYVDSRVDPALEKLFDKEGSKFCENTNNQLDFFGKQSCKSAYATYTVVVPKGDHDCNLDPNEWVDGLNCDGLDLTKFNAVRVYTRIKSWSDYPAQSQAYNLILCQSKDQQCESL
ncbi:unnamed protein product [Clavelina lepadiformis]|uniref:Uncharacterized protein n=1 Tax=Clavelina lepadiformis TaxID=159417 RepID=A0ABP0G855_CLALP